MKRKITSTALALATVLALLTVACSQVAPVEIPEYRQSNEYVAYSDKPMLAAVRDVAAKLQSQPGPTANQAKPPSDWALTEVNEAIEAGLVPDSVSGAGWQNATTRLAAADAIVLLIEQASGKTMQQISDECGWDLSTNQFSDTDSRAVTFLKYAEITTGIGDNRYEPDGGYTRAQIVTMIGRSAEAFFGATAQGANPFSDVPDWAAPFVGYAADNSITQGVGGGKFNSDGILEGQHLAVFCLRTYNAWTGKTVPNKPLAAYRAYRELVMSLIDEYGIGYNHGNNGYHLDVDNWWTVEYSGVVYAELIDFDNDGLPELLVIYNDGDTQFFDTWEIYGYTGNVELYFTKLFGYEGGGGSDAEVAIGDDGTRYLVYGSYYVVYGDEQDYTYYTLVDGSWVTALTRSASITYESTHWEYEGDFEWEWHVNDLLVSEDEFMAAPETELGIIEAISFPFYTRIQEDLDAKNKRASEFVNELLTELQDKIAQLET